VSLVKPRNRLIEFRQRRIGQPSHRPQRMPHRNPRLDVDVREQRPDRLILASHLSRAIRSANSRNHAKRQNTSDFLRDFLSSLLGRERIFARKADAITLTDRLSIDQQPNALDSPYGLDEQCSAKAIFIDKPPR
jgi:hypothetical protein